MKLLSKLKENKIYKNNKLILLSSLAARRKGNIIFTLGNNNLKDTKNILDTTTLDLLLQSKLVDTSSYNAIYHERYLDFKPHFNKRIKFDQKEYYETILSKHPTKKFLKQKIEQYAGRNLIYDLTPSFTYLLYRITNPTKKIPAINNYLFDRITSTDFDQYPTKFLLVSLDLEFKNFKQNFMTIWKYNRPKFNLTFIDHLMRNDILQESLKGPDFLKKYPNANNSKIYLVFYSESMGYFFYLDIHNLPDYKLIRRRLNFILKTVNGYSITLDKDELEAAPDNDELDVIKDKLKPITKSIEQRQNMANFRVATAPVVNKLSYLYRTNFNLYGDDDDNDESTILNILDNQTDEEVNELLDSLDKRIDDATVNKDEPRDKVIDKLNNDTKFKEELATVTNIQSVDRFTDVEKRLMEKAKGNQLKVSIKHKGFNTLKNASDLTVADILESTKEKSIDETKFNNTTVIDDSLKSCKLSDFEESYTKKTLKHDYYNIFLYFNKDKLNPLFIKKFEVTNNSDELTFKETYEVEYTNKSNKKEKIKIDIPMIIDNRYIMVNGTKRILLKQILALPLTKTDTNEVFLTTNYNKFQILRKGNKLNNTVNKVIKLLTVNNAKLAKDGVIIEFSDNTEANFRTINSIEYNNYAKVIGSISVKGTQILFNRSVMMGQLESLLRYPEIEKYVKDGYVPFAKSASAIHYINLATDKVYIFDGTTFKEVFQSISHFILDKLMSTVKSINILDELNAQSDIKSLMFSEVGILNKKIPMIILLSFYEGFTKILEQYGITYEFIDKSRFKLDDSDMHFKNIIKFKDGVIVYEASTRNELLLNGLTAMNTRSLMFHEMDVPQSYLNYFEDSLKTSKNISKGLRWSLDRMIDPITEEVLMDTGKPTDISGLLLEANSLLADEKFHPRNYVGNYRIRGNESIASYLYKILADQFNVYLAGVGKFSVPQNILIDTLLASKAVEEFSTLNPMFECELFTKATMKGNVGLNSDHAYTGKVRSFSKSMEGLFSPYCPTSASAGIQRFLTYNPKIKGIRGYIDTDEHDYNSSELLSPNELCQPFTARQSDPARQPMTTKQSSHVIPTKHTDMPMIGSGSEKILKNILSREFIYTAKQDGTVKEIDNKANLMVIEFKDGTQDVIDVGEQISKNSSSGFYIDNKLVSHVKAGQTFKKGDVLVSNPDFFVKGNMNNDLFMSIGTLAKVVMIPQDLTIEDSAFITKKFAKKLTSTVIMKEDIILNTNTNILKMVSIGDHVKSGEPLIIFENTLNDRQAVDLLAKMADEFKETINELSSTSKKAKYSGHIVDIKIYYNKPLEEFTPSVKKIINSFISYNKHKINKVKSANLNQPVNFPMPTIEMIKSPRIKNIDVDGLLIEFFISHEDHMKIGDKLSHQAACKTIVSRLLDEGKEPTTEHGDQPVDVIFSPLSIVSRMTIDLISNMYANKVLYELKNKVKEIANS